MNFKIGYHFFNTYTKTKLYINIILCSNIIFYQYILQCNSLLIGSCSPPPSKTSKTSKSKIISEETLEDFINS